MAEELNGKTVAILAADGFEQSELFEPKKALENCGRENSYRVAAKRTNQRLERERIGAKLSPSM